MRQWSFDKFRPPRGVTPYVLCSCVWLSPFVFGRFDPPYMSWDFSIYRLRTLLRIFLFWYERLTPGVGAVLQLVLLLVSRVIIGSGPLQCVHNGLRGTPGRLRHPGRSRGASRGIAGCPGVVLSVLVGPHPASG